MRLLLLLFTTMCFGYSVYSQSVSNTATDLKFDQRYTRCERKWVVISKADTAKTYTYGYIYIDQQAGFTFDLQGVFKVDDKGKYIKDTMIFKNTGSIKYRGSPNWRPIALLPETHFKELKIQPEPEWAKIYYHNYKDTAYYNYRMGWVYNDANECEIALTYLDKARNIKPHKIDVEFEIAYAYNVLNRFNETVNMLEPAAKEMPNNPLLKKELGYAYFKLKDYDNALAVYLQAINLFPNEKSEAKGEVAFNMASIYQTQGKTQVYKIWMLKAKDFTPENSSIYKRITDAGF